MEMVYFLSVSNPYDESVGTPIINDPRQAPLMEMAYADPEDVYWTAKRRNTVQMKQGYPVDSQTAPKAIMWESDKFPLPDVISNQQVIVSCERLRDLVEQFEPGVHQFIPVSVYVPGQNQPVSTYYWFVVCQRLDSVDRDRSTYRWELDYTGQSGFWSRKDIENPALVFSLERTAGRHIWMDPHVLGLNSPFCSANFGRAALEKKFSGLNVTLQKTT